MSQNYSFSEAAKAAKDGKRIRRAAWGANCLFIYKFVPGSIPADQVTSIASLPNDVKHHFVKEGAGIHHSAQWAAVGTGGRVIGHEFSPYDRRANDWEILESDPDAPDYSVKPTQNTSTMKNLEFYEAHRAVEEGKLIRRASWPAHVLFVFKQVESVVPVEVIPKMSSLPEAAKHHFVKEGLEIRYHDQYALVIAGSSVSGYRFDDQDMAGEDWEVLESDPAAPVYGAAPVAETVGTAKTGGQIKVEVSHGAAGDAENYPKVRQLQACAAHHAKAGDTEAAKACEDAAKDMEESAEPPMMGISDVTNG